ncbi:hypothetical protein RclHR1_03590003 [Rhizophagus clarus]|uniref:Galactose oxidase n=1 Tax=Rhizophagus clarus TaxID=94130 RepID=A0A2Z6S677_9GLOM|nr:hypothetical protein RclHR1_03590003 [Rhizophagus clarus]GET01618.1 hypothetical protein GLOIN_2v1761507 [Rhizophagus clarus]
MAPYKPNKRIGHTATLIDNKLYILGGFSAGHVGKDFFYLDVSVSFNTQNLPWNDLSNINIVPSHSDAATVKGGASNSSLFLYGGANDTVTDFLVYIFNPQGDSWNIPKITGNTPVRKSKLTGIIDHTGIMYLWGGYNEDINVDVSDVNDMLILDTINLVWGKGSLVGVPTVREYYGGTLLANNNIIYMGGYDSYNGKELTLNQMTSGEIPSGRDSFSIVLGLDGQRVIIFGGSATKDLTPEDSLYELNLINFEWRIPKVFGQIPESRMNHKANVIGKYMVISFGYGYDNIPTESDILLLDISNVDEYIWTNEFYPLPPPLPPSPSSPPLSTSTLNKLPSSISKSSIPSSATLPTTTVIGAIIGTLFGAALLSFGGFYLYKNKCRDDNNQVEKNIDTHGQEIVQLHDLQ